MKIPTIGIGAGNGTDGQVLVLHDMLGINKDFNPRFLRRYMNLFDDIKNATEHYISDVESKDFSERTGTILSCVGHPEILYEDNHIVVVNKLPGEIVQGDKTGDVPL